ncbi:hypothetical protein HBB16_10095 [Pseudonocardia sp. MCCB 268]|nr:hypothetical protein [Pseudonocardia cytotoxica]
MTVTALVAARRDVGYRQQAGVKGRASCAAAVLSPTSFRHLGCPARPCA